MRKWKSIYRPKKLKEIEHWDWVVLGFLVVSSILFIIFYKFLQQEFILAIKEFGIAGLFLFVALLEIVPQVIHPFWGVIAIVGLGGNIVSAVFVSILGMIAGSIIGYEIGNRWGYGICGHLFSYKSMSNITKLWDKYGLWFIFVSAISPVPYFPTIFGILGIKRIPFWTYGIVPRVFGYLVLGVFLNFGLSFL